MVSFYWHCIPNFVETIAPISDFTLNGVQSRRGLLPKSTVMWTGGYCLWSYGRFTIKCLQLPAEPAESAEGSANASFQDQYISLSSLISWLFQVFHINVTLQQVSLNVTVLSHACPVSLLEGFGASWPWTCWWLWWSSSSQVFLKWPKQQRHHEDHYSQSKYRQYQSVL